MGKRPRVQDDSDDDNQLSLFQDDNPIGMLPSGELNIVEADEPFEEVPDKEDKRGA